jgi:hypothetical protein
LSGREKEGHFWGGRKRDISDIHSKGERGTFLISTPAGRKRDLADIHSKKAAEKQAAQE